jgi:DNA-binding beta-propeller fold protein YncE
VPRKHPVVFTCLAAVILVGVTALHPAYSAHKNTINLPTSKRLTLPAPGNPQRTNSFPTALALSHDGRYLAILNNGYGTDQSDDDESIAILDLSTDVQTDYPDLRTRQKAHQTYFLGLGFSPDGHRLYASLASMTDPTGAEYGDTGNGIAVYKFSRGRISHEGFLKIPLQPPLAGQRAIKLSKMTPPIELVPYPAGLIALQYAGRDELLVANNLADNAILTDARSGRILHRFDLSTSRYVPGSYPYGVAATRDGRTGFCSLWNASQVAELDLTSGRVLRRITLLPPKSPHAPGSHPSALLLSPDQKLLYVTLSNADRLAAVNVASGNVVAWLDTELPGERFGGTYPNALAQTPDGKLLFVADAGSDAVAVFDVQGLRRGHRANGQAADLRPRGFIPTEWYPTALAVAGGDLIIATGKGQGTGPNAFPLPPGRAENAAAYHGHPPYRYIATLIHGSVARLRIKDLESELPAMTGEVEASNRIAANLGTIHFAHGSNPIKHAIYIIKENRTYDQIFGDLKPGNADPALTMFGWDITPNEHKLARQFGILDNFYCSGEVSGNGHVWSMAAIDSDYTEKTWEIAYRGEERDYDYEGQVNTGFPIQEGQPDVDEPGTGYIWGDVARHGISHRNYGEFVATEWCNEFHSGRSPLAGTPLPPGRSCARSYIHRGEPLPSNVGEPHGSRSPWPWPVPIIARDVPTMPELVGHYDPRFADFKLDYPDQLRVDEFLNEFQSFVRAREDGKGAAAELPQFVILRLPDDHTAGTKPGWPKPEASIADNDLAVGRVVDAVSHSPYWDDTAIFILEDDAQDGPDHVDAHRSTALVISKYSPGSSQNPFVDSRFYTTVNMVRTMEVLLGLPPMNNDDARASVMARLFSGSGDQPAFHADYRNQKNGLIYQTNSAASPGAKESARMDFSHADAVNSAELCRASSQKMTRRG